MPQDDDGTLTDNTDETTTEDGNTSGNSGSTSTAKVGGKTAEEWKNSYNGLQVTYQRLKDSTDQKIADLQRQLGEANAQIEELKQGKTTAEGKIAALTQEKEDLSTQNQTLSGEKTQLETAVSRSKLVMSEYPELAAFEAQGLLPVAADEETMRSLFNNFRDTMQSQVGTQVKKTVQGTQPTGSGRTSTQTTKTSAGEDDEDYIWAKMAEASKKGDTADFNMWQRKYDAIQDAKGK